jgi:hypothetical protein
MSVPGQLDRDASRGGFPGIPRLMIEQKDRRGCGRAGKSNVQVRWRLSVLGRRQVGHASNDQASVVARENCMGVRQHANTEAAEVSRPGCITEEVFVVAGYGQNAVRRAKVAQRRNIGPAHFDRPVDEVAGDDDEVGSKRSQCGEPPHRVPPTRFRLKKSVSLFQGIMFTRSYRSVWLAPGTITSSLGSAAARKSQR